jgi:hypothetical protein
VIPLLYVRDIPGHVERIIFSAVIKPVGRGRAEIMSDRDIRKSEESKYGNSRP